MFDIKLRRFPKPIGRKKFPSIAILESLTPDQLRIIFRDGFGESFTRWEEVTLPPEMSPL